MAVPSRAVSTGGIGKRGEQMPVEGQSRVQSLQWKNPEGVGAGWRESRLGCAHVEPECESPGLKAACFDELKLNARGRCPPAQEVNFRHAGTPITPPGSPSSWSSSGWLTGRSTETFSTGGGVGGFGDWGGLMMRPCSMISLICTPSRVSYSKSARAIASSLSLCLSRTSLAWL